MSHWALTGKESEIVAELKLLGLKRLLILVLLNDIAAFETEKIK